jgi:hypothetical protein
LRAISSVKKLSSVVAVVAVAVSALLGTSGTALAGTNGQKLRACVKRSNMSTYWQYTGQNQRGTLVSPWGYFTNKGEIWKCGEAGNYWWVGG